MYPDISFNSLSKFLSISGFPILSGHDRTKWPAVQMCNISNLNFLKRIYAYCIGICAHISIKRFWLHNFSSQAKRKILISLILFIWWKLFLWASNKKIRWAVLWTSLSFAAVVEPCSMTELNHASAYLTMHVLIYIHIFVFNLHFLHTLACSQIFCASREVWVSCFMFKVSRFKECFH